MDNEPKKLVITLLTGIALLFLGVLFVDNVPLGYTNAAIVYLAGVTGAGCFWIGLHGGKGA